uniref:Uncharacterized protein n=1 Tax=Porodaedalea pini TaxID=108901 RepID=A0A5B9RJH3_9AGAM|nr:hypothetical protein PPIT_000064 [Porodaedalea pini]QEG56945.1 hypothetical protein PPIT_000064 [Porodaedalea pini]
MVFSFIILISSKKNKIKKMKNNNNNYNNNYSNDNDKSYLLACFARSLDQFHVKNNMIHLLGSIFYTKSVIFDLLKRFATNYKYNATIIRLSPVADLNFNVIEHSEYLVEVQFSIFYFLELYRGGGQSFDDFLEELFSMESLAEQNKNPNFKYSKVLFVFEDLNWFTLQLLFKMKGIKLSGGSISKRQILSSAELSLSLFLLMLGFTDIDAYNSYKYLANLSKSDVKSDESDLTIDIERQSLYYLMKTGLSKDKDTLSITIANLDKDILNKRRNLESLELSLSSKKNEILRAKKLLSNSKSIINLNKNIELIKKFIDNKENELLLLNSKLSDITKEIDNLTEIPYTELKAKYFKIYHNLKKYNDVTMLKKQLSKATNISRSFVNRKAGSAPVSRTGCRGLYTQSTPPAGRLVE